MRLAGEYEVDGYLDYTDLVDLSANTILGAVLTDTLQVNSAATVNIISFLVDPDTVSSGQDSVFAQVVYQNQGTAAAEVRIAELSYSLANGSFITVLTKGQTVPFTLAGNEIDTLEYLITVPASIENQDIFVKDSIEIRDLNLGVNSGASALDSFYVQRPASPAYAGDIITNFY